MKIAKEAKEDRLKITGNSHLVALPVRPENIIHFPDGLPAFEDVREFVFLSPPDTRPFFLMQALNPRDLSFVCIDPFLISSDYRPNICEEDVKALQLESPRDAFLFSIVTITRDLRNITVNLQGPVVINIRTGIGKQVLCVGQNYPVRFRLWDLVLEKTRQAESSQENGAKASSRAVEFAGQAQVEAGAARELESKK